jgi:hypothetical protein
MDQRLVSVAVSSVVIAVSSVVVAVSSVVVAIVDSVPALVAVPIVVSVPIVSSSADILTDISPVTVYVAAQVVYATVKRARFGPVAAAAGFIAAVVQAGKDALIPADILDIAVDMVASITVPVIGTSGRGARDPQEKRGNPERGREAHAQWVHGFHCLSISSASFPRHLCDGSAERLQSVTPVKRKPGKDVTA